MAVKIWMPTVFWVGVAVDQGPAAKQRVVIVAAVYGDDGTRIEGEGTGQSHVTAFGFGEDEVARQVGVVVRKPVGRHRAFVLDGSVMRPLASPSGATATGQPRGRKHADAAFAARVPPAQVAEVGLRIHAHNRSALRPTWMTWRRPQGMLITRHL